jgi:thiol-disulfide isomerase/thioredoxin
LSGDGSKAPLTRKVVLYSRVYCHLCDDMAAAVAPLAKEFGFAVEVVDVDQSAELEARYGERVPVLVLAGVELCHYFLDTALVRDRLREFR